MSNPGVNLLFIPSIHLPISLKHRRDAFQRFYLLPLCYAAPRFRERLQMSTGKRINVPHVEQGQASTRNQPVVVQIGCGVDLHGQNATIASVRACRSESLIFFRCDLLSLYLLAEKIIHV